MTPEIQSALDRIDADFSALKAALGVSMPSAEPTALSPISVGVTTHPGVRYTLVTCPSAAQLTAASVDAATVAKIRDWRVCPSPVDAWCKYAGGIQPIGPTAIQVNGTPVNGGEYYLEAVDALGPYAPMSSMTGNVADNSMSGMVPINGHGDGTMPNTLLRIGPLTLSSLAEPASNGWSFDFDLSNMSALPVTAATSGDPATVIRDGMAGAHAVTDATYALWQAGNMRVEHHGTAIDDTHLFVDHGHLMTTVRAGIKSAPDTANASILMQPVGADGNEFVMDLSGGAKWRVSASMVGHQNDRQWAELWLVEPGVRVINGGKFDSADGGDNVAVIGGTRDTGAGGWLLRWKPTIVHYVAVFDSGQKLNTVPHDNRYSPFSLTQQMARGRWYGDKRAISDTGTKMCNGNDGDHDLQHLFEIEVSQSGYTIRETGADGAVLFTHSDTWPSGVTVPTKLVPRWRHAVYHPILNEQELPPDETLWRLKLQRGDMTDTQHWNMLRVERI